MGKKKKILVVGQTPPPFHGQAMMIQRFVHNIFDSIEIIHLRLSFSRKSTEIGTFSLWKLSHLISIIFQTIYLKYRFNIDSVFYYPAGPNLTPILRDWIFLFFIRIHFKNVIFQFRAAGISDYLKSKNFLLRKFLRFPFYKPDLSIQLASLNPKDGEFFKSKRTIVIPNGIEDEVQQYLPLTRDHTKINILYIGAIRESKGVIDLLDAIVILKKSSTNFKLFFAGEFYDNDIEQRIQEIINSKDLHGNVEFLGPLVNENKWELFSKCQILCFPTYFESESFGNVLLEAMMFEMAIVASAWRAIPEIVVEGNSGLLYPSRNIDELANKLKYLINNPSIISQMGKNGRKIFEKKYTLDIHLRAMEESILNVIK